MPIPFYGGVNMILDYGIVDIIGQQGFNELYEKLLIQEHKANKVSQRKTQEKINGWREKENMPPISLGYIKNRWNK